MVVTLLTETPLSEMPAPNRRPWQPHQVFRALNDWCRWADTLVARRRASGYGTELGRSTMPSEARFIRLATLYADIEQHLSYQPARQADAVRLYFRGALDTDPGSGTFALYVRPVGVIGLGQLLGLRTSDASALLYAGLEALLMTLCALSGEAAAEEVLIWRAERKYQGKATWTPT